MSAAASGCMLSQRCAALYHRCRAADKPLREWQTAVIQHLRERLTPINQF
ncbi:hypothetical protein [Paraburkholderia sediminicola]